MKNLGFVRSFLCDLNLKSFRVARLCSKKIEFPSKFRLFGEIFLNFNFFLHFQVNKMTGHSARVGALAWNSDILSSGSRDRLILQRDTRTPSQTSDRRLVGHRQEVCGLKWSPDNQYLASGGNDNRLYVWNQHSQGPVQAYSEHMAAVKAIAWSPHHHGLLASGGGTADRCIRFWNTLTGQPMQSVDTGKSKFELCA